MWKKLSKNNIPQRLPNQDLLHLAAALLHYHSQWDQTYKENIDIKNIIRRIRLEKRDELTTTSPWELLILLPLQLGVGYSLSVPHGLSISQYHHAYKLFSFQLMQPVEASWTICLFDAMSIFHLSHPIKETMRRSVGLSQIKKHKERDILVITIRSMHSIRKPKRALISAASWFPRIKCIWWGCSTYISMI